MRGWSAFESRYRCGVGDAMEGLHLVWRGCGAISGTRRLTAGELLVVGKARREFRFLKSR